MISAYRIVKPKHEATAFTGEGARLFGGRWNSAGRAVVYVAGSRSLAAMEMLVHLEADEVLETYRLAQIELDASDVAELVQDNLPTAWRDDPASQGTQSIGDDWIEAGSSLALRVPSTIIPSEFNFLLNPAHPRFGDLRLGQFENFFFDPRLVKSR